MDGKKWAVSSACALSIALAPTASAQDQPVVVEDRVTLEQEPVVVEERVVVEQPGAPPLDQGMPQRMDVEQPEQRSTIRPRLGISALGGYTFNEPEGWMLGGSLRLGVQIGDWLAVYYQPTALYASLNTPGGGDDGAFTLWNSLLLEATLFDFVSVAAGPSVDIWASCGAGAQGTGGPDSPSGDLGCARDAAFFGLHGRVAVNLGSMGPGDRRAIQLSAEVHPTWFGDDLQTIALLGGLGVDMY